MRQEVQVRTVPATTEQRAALSQAVAGDSGPRFSCRWLDDLSTDTAATDCVKGIIGSKSLILIYGPSGDGKTFFTIDLVLHICAGLPHYRGRRIRQGLWVYVAAEAGVSIAKRMVASRDQLLSETREGRVPLAIIMRGPNLFDLGEVEALLHELRVIEKEAGVPLAGIVLDTLSRTMPGSEEGAADFGCAINFGDRLRDELGASTIFVHHSGKDATKGLRGHSSLFAAADTVISVKERVALIEKSRDGATGEQFAFDLHVVELGPDADGDLITTCVVVPTQVVAPQRKERELSGVAKVALQALKEAIAATGKTMPETTTIPRGVHAVMIERWRAQFEVRYGSDGKEKRDADTVKKAFQRGREALLKVSAVGISDPFAWVIG